MYFQLLILLKSSPLVLFLTLLLTWPGMQRTSRPSPAAECEA